MEILNRAEEKMKKTVAVLEEDLKTIRTGIAHVSLPDRAQFEYYGSPAPTNQVASVKVVGGRQLVIRLYDRDTLKDIERVIRASNAGLVPQSDEGVIRLNALVLMEEHRKKLAKSTHKMGEEAKVAIRNIRCDANDTVKKNRELTEDLKKDTQEKIQELTDKVGKSIDSAIDTKAKEVMRV